MGIHNGSHLSSPSTVERQFVNEIVEFVKHQRIEYIGHVQYFMSDDRIQL